jgi:catechol-2,3-dioxygenase
MTTAVARKAPNLAFSHMGISVANLPRMEKFYTEVLGFAVTDRGDAGGMSIVFMSRDPLDHHQVILATGRPEAMPANTANPQFGPSINQISFRVSDLAELRSIYGRLQEGGASSFLLANHGIAWSIYAHDPEGNNLEFFVDTDWYMTQPMLIPLDFSKSDQEIFDLTKNMCEHSPGFEPYTSWRQKVAKRMTKFMPPAGPT